ncbi:MAG: holo-ACP synthase [Bacilli bacterium]
MNVGIDIIKNERIHLNENFLNRILSKNELELLSKRNDKVEFVAGRWAAKEAFLKSLRQNIKGFDLRLIEVLSDINGAPFIIYNEKEYTNISISHEKEYTIAIAIAN